MRARAELLFRLSVMTLSTCGNPSSTGATQSSSKMSMDACGRNLFNAISEGVDKTVSPIERSRTTRTRSTVCQSHLAAASGCGDSSPRKLCIRRSRNWGDDSTISLRLFNGAIQRNDSKGCLTLFGSSIFCAAFYPVLYLRFVNQHHRNVVANGVNAPAFNALQGAAIGLQLNPCLAGRAGEYFQQILTDWHRGGPHIAVFWAYPGALERGI